MILMVSILSFCFGFFVVDQFNIKKYLLPARLVCHLIVITCVLMLLYTWYEVCLWFAPEYRYRYDVLSQVIVIMFVALPFLIPYFIGVFIANLSTEEDPSP